jgi:hypothetical protein
VILILNDEFIEAEPITPAYSHPMPLGSYRHVAGGSAVVSCPQCGKYFYFKHEMHEIVRLGNHGVVRFVECPRCDWYGTLALLAWFNSREGGGG